MKKQPVIVERQKQENDMKMWEIREGYDPEFDRNMGYRREMGDGEYEEGFEDGCEHGYKKAMKEMRMMGMRGNQGSGYGRGNSGNSRFMPPYTPYMNYRDDDDNDDMDDMMQQRRRRRDSRGRYM